MATVRDLYDALGEMLDTEAGSDVLIATQPSWPFENYIAEVRLVEFVADHPFNHEEGTRLDLEHCSICGQHAEHDDHQMKTQVYIVDGGQKGYLPSEAKAELGW